MREYMLLHEHWTAAPSSMSQLVAKRHDGSRWSMIISVNRTIQVFHCSDLMVVWTLSCSPIALSFESNLDCITVYTADGRIWRLPYDVPVKSHRKRKRDIEHSVVPTIPILHSRRPDASMCIGKWYNCKTMTTACFHNGLVVATNDGRRVWCIDTSTPTASDSTDNCSDKSLLLSQAVMLSKCLILLVSNDISPILFTALFGSNAACSGLTGVIVASNGLLSVSILNSTIPGVSSVSPLFDINEPVTAMNFTCLSTKAEGYPDALVVIGESGRIVVIKSASTDVDLTEISELIWLPLRDGVIMATYWLPGPSGVAVISRCGLIVFSGGSVSILSATRLHSSAPHILVAHELDIKNVKVVVCACNGKCVASKRGCIIVGHTWDGRVFVIASVLLTTSTVSTPELKIPSLSSSVLANQLEILKVEAEMHTKMAQQSTLLSLKLKEICSLFRLMSGANMSILVSCKLKAYQDNSICLFIRNTGNESLGDGWNVLVTLKCHSVQWTGSDAAVGAKAARDVHVLAGDDTILSFSMSVSGLRDNDEIRKIWPLPPFSSLPIDASVVLRYDWNVSNADNISEEPPMSPLLFPSTNVRLDILDWAIVKPLTQPTSSELHKVDPFVLGSAERVAMSMKRDIHQSRMPSLSSSNRKGDDDDTVNKTIISLCNATVHEHERAPLLDAKSFLPDRFCFSLSTNSSCNVIASLLGSEFDDFIGDISVELSSGATFSLKIEHNNVTGFVDIVIEAQSVAARVALPTLHEALLYRALQSSTVSLCRSNQSFLPLSRTISKIQDEFYIHNLKIMDPIVIIPAVTQLIDQYRKCRE